MKGAIVAVLVALLGLSVRWPEIGIRGSRPVRDLWQHCDLGAFADGFVADVPAHGAVLVRVGAATAAVTATAPRAALPPE